MVIRQIIEPTKPNPVLADAAIGEINKALANVAWLEQVLGRSWKVTRELNGRKYSEPCIYVGGDTGREYETVVPSDDLGNYSFWVLRDPDLVYSENGIVRVPYSLIVWCDVRTCFVEPNRRDTENLKRDILSVLTREAWFRFGEVTVEKVYEEAVNVFKGYTLDETANQYLMHPYAGFRFDGELLVDNHCWINNNN